MAIFLDTYTYARAYARPFIRRAIRRSPKLARFIYHITVDFHYQATAYQCRRHAIT